MYEKYIGEYWWTLRRHAESSSRPKSYVPPFTLNPRQLGGIARAGLVGEVAHIGLSAQPVLHRCLERVAVDTQPHPNPPQPGSHAFYSQSKPVSLCGARASAGTVPGASRETSSWRGLGWEFFCTPTYYFSTPSPAFSLQVQEKSKDFFSGSLVSFPYHMEEWDSVLTCIQGK